MAATSALSVDFEQEVRFALVVYGGVSLAIYINGVTQEFLRLVRATAVDEAGELVFPEVTGTEAVYRKLASIARRGAEGPPDSRLRTRFIVDIASGTSAGGINAIFLAKALANGGSLDAIATLWLKQAEIRDLLNDDKGNDGRAFAQSEPQSLLSSRGMYEKLLDALDSMDQSNQLGRALQPELDIFVTATDHRDAGAPYHRPADGAQARVRGAHSRSAQGRSAHGAQLRRERLRRDGVTASIRDDPRRSAAAARSQSPDRAGQGSDEPPGAGRRCVEGRACPWRCGPRGGERLCTAAPNGPGRRARAELRQLPPAQGARGDRRPGEHRGPGPELARGLG